LTQKPKTLDDDQEPDHPFGRDLMEPFGISVETTAEILVGVDDNPTHDCLCRMQNNRRKI